MQSYYWIKMLNKIGLLRTVELVFKQPELNELRSSVSALKTVHETYFCFFSGVYIVCLCVLCMSFFLDQKLFRLRMCSKQTSDYSIWRKSRVASSHC